MDTLSNQNTTNNTQQINSEVQTPKKNKEVKNDSSTTDQTNTENTITDEVAFESLKYDNSSMRTSIKAAQSFYGQLSRDNINRMTTFMLDGTETVPANPEILMVSNTTLGTDYVTSDGVTTDDSTLVGLAENPEYKTYKTKFVEGGYRFLATDEGMSGLISKRLENDLGQQTQGANYVFRSNDYVSTDVAARLAIDGKSRVCKTLEVISELWYNYDPTVTFGLQTSGHQTSRPVFIFDYQDYDTSALQQWLDKVPSQYIYVISETKSYDAICAVGRMLTGSYKIHRDKTPQIFFLSNAQNPLKAGRCIINIEGYLLNGPDKLRFGDSREIQVALQRYLGFNTTAFSYYAIADLRMDGVYFDGRYILQALAQTTTTFTTVAEFDLTTWGSLISNPTPAHYPVSNQKYNNKDIFNAICYLTEMLYDVCTPFGYCDYNLQKAMSNQDAGKYGYATLPICDWLLRVAWDKNIIQPVVNKNHKLNNRNVLAQKLKILATYKAGRLLGCISEIFGSLNNMSRFKHIGLINAVTYILDAQNCGFYDQEFLIGMIGHAPFVPASTTAIYSIPSHATPVGSYAPGNTNTTSIWVTEYAPMAAYWRVDLFGSPLASDINVQQERWPTSISAGWRDLDRKRYICDTTTFAGKIGYRFDNTGTFNYVGIGFESKYIGNNKGSSYGILQLPTMFWDKRTFTEGKFRPNSMSMSSGTYPIMYSDQHLAQVYDNGSTDRYEDILFH